jgi:formylglycine-generating enzyme required for sulfatase activity
MTVKSFSAKTSDLTASTQQRKDYNDTPCALVKVLLAVSGAQFEPNVIGNVINKTSEYWVYLPAGSKHLRVKHSSFLPKDVVFEEYGISKLESKTTYELVMTVPSGPVKQSPTSQFLVFQVEPKDAIVTVDGTVWDNKGGVASKVVPFGRYNYRVEHKMYHPEVSSVEVNNPNQKVQIVSTLKPAFGYISIPSDNNLSGALIYIDKELAGKAPLVSDPLASGPHTVMAVKSLYQSQEQTVMVQDGQTHRVIPSMTADYATVTFTVANQAEIWVNGERKGVGQWTGDLASGEYMVETRLTNHRSASSSKHISSSPSRQTIALDAPMPIYGKVIITSTPSMADIYLDDKLVGQTPLILQECLIGKHNIRVSKNGYGDYQTSITVQEGRTNEVECPLSNLVTVKLSSDNAPDAQVCVDGVEMGALRFVKELSIGRHEITLKDDFYSDYTKTIEVTMSQRSFNFTMLSASPKKKTFSVKGVSFNMITVAGGTFQMGATASQKNAAANEKPAHKVTLSNYYIGETEVTQALWQAVMGYNPSNLIGNDRPVEMVSWQYCQTFIRRLNDITGQCFRLPTEAEWEYASRGGRLSKNYLYSGGNKLGDVAWYKDNASDRTQNVRSKKPNELGIYDMSGNVSEWCQDWFGSYENKDVTNPTGPRYGSTRVIRGGSKYTQASYCRSTFRSSNKPGEPFYSVGLRLVLSSVADNSNVQTTTRKEEIFKVKGVTFSMIPVNKGTFNMGTSTVSSSSKNSRTSKTTANNTTANVSNSSPQHVVSLSDYYIGETEVTQALWNAVMGTNPSLHKGIYYPVENVSWYDCQLFIQKLNALTHRRFRLPTEAEWEYAARGGQWKVEYVYPGGDTPASVLWSSENARGVTQTIKRKRPNELILFDMGGNVAEWCHDVYDKYVSDVQSNPLGQLGGYWQGPRVVRGGSCKTPSSECLSTYRMFDYPDNPSTDRGLRLALSDTVEYSNTPLEHIVFTEDTDGETQLFTLNGVPFRMLPVAGGSLKLGATSDQKRNSPPKDEKAHKETISSFYIGETEVTQALWKVVMGSNPSSHKGDNLPVEMVTWDDCQIFINRLNAITGKNFRLPSANEWEYAARGGKRTKKSLYAGSNIVYEVAWYSGNSKKNSSNVKFKRPNELGIYDMCGNVSEWCRNTKSSYYAREVRGGSFLFDALQCLPSVRKCEIQWDRTPYIGFRLAL